MNASKRRPAMPGLLPLAAQAAAGIAAACRC
jgi:hypothetical protein